MKKILIVDESPLMREFLRTKLHEFGFKVEEAPNGFDGFRKLRKTEPDLLIIDYYITRLKALEFLELKFKDPNLKSIPILFMSGKISRHTLLELSKFGITKFITKPIKIDILTRSLSELFNIRLKLDTTPCIIDANYNDEVMFIEVARGLNTEKIEILKYRLQELMRLYRIANPKVLLMFSGVNFTDADSTKFRALITSIRTATNVAQRNLTILTTSETVKDFVRYLGDLQPAVLESLSDAMETLLGGWAGGYRNVEGQVHGDFLRVGHSEEETDSKFNLRFHSEKRANDFAFDVIAKELHLAVVDDDAAVHEMVKQTFSHAGPQIETFLNGKAFIESSNIRKFDLVFLDLVMPGVDGLGVLNTLNRKNIDIPIIILAESGQRNAVMRALQMGVKSCLLKPIQPEMIYKKSLEIIQLNF